MSHVVQRQELVEYVSGGVSERRRQELATLIEASPELQHEVRTLQRAMHAWQQATVGEQSIVARQKMIARALAARGSQRRWGLLYAVAGGAVAAALALMLLWPTQKLPESSAPALALASGRVAVQGRNLAKGELVADRSPLFARSVSELTWGKGRLTLQRRAKVLRQGQALRLLHGKIGYRAHGPRVLLTQEVSLALVAGAVVKLERVEARTMVFVQDGVVMAAVQQGQQRRLVAGDRAIFPPASTGLATADGGGIARARADARVRDSTPDLQSQARVSKAVVRRRAARAIRRVIGKGQVARARRMLRRVRRQVGPSAELAIVAAEADLAERKIRHAIAAYMHVVKRYRRSPQAEAALFAAAQLAIDHPGAGQDGAALLSRYLARYPRGRFVSVARRLQEALKRRAR